jgi:hypothetical protein
VDDVDCGCQNFFNLNPADFANAQLQLLVQFREEFPDSLPRFLPKEAVQEQVERLPETVRVPKEDRVSEGGFDVAGCTEFVRDGEDFGERTVAEKPAVFGLAKSDSIFSRGNYGGDLVVA